jgi:hypothetical protein
LETSAADLLNRLPFPVLVVVAGEPNTFWAISAKVLRKARSFFVSAMSCVLRLFAQGVKSLRTKIQYKVCELKSNNQHNQINNA